MDRPGHLLIDGFLASAKHNSHRPALIVKDKIYSYGELAAEANNLAATISQACGSSPLVGVLAHKSLTAFSGILGSLISGRGYVPMQPQHPIERIRKSIEAAELDVIVAGGESMDCLKALLPVVDRAITVIAPYVDDVSDLQSNANKHKVLGSSELMESNEIHLRRNQTPDDIAYLIFTSGSTGMPKGVPVRNRNVVPFVTYMSNRCKANPADRFSQISDLTFDLSIFPVWTCWENGACLCCVSDEDRLAPAKFVRDKQITVWTSVPSAVVLLKRMRLLKPNSFPMVRYSFFCGEPLTSDSAKHWQAACPNSVVENMYGPTEAACAISYFPWTGDDSRCVNGIVPIGWPFETQRAAVVDENLAPVPDGSEGELCLAGSQVVDGYLNDPEKTNEKYVRIPALGSDTWYRTGDLASKADDGCFFFRGRIDFQVKILGHRIELQEIEQVIREATQSAMVVCLPWPMVDGAAQGLVGFASQTDGCDESSVIRHCEKSLPEYMVPKRIYFLAKLPLNSNGKIDRGELAKLLRDGKL